MGPWKADGLAGDPTSRGPIVFRVLTCVAKCADRQELILYFLFGIDDDTEERKFILENRAMFRFGSNSILQF